MKKCFVKETLFRGGLIRGGLFHLQVREHGGLFDGGLLEGGGLIEDLRYVE